MICLWNFNLAGTHTFLYKKKQFNIAVFWLWLCSQFICLINYHYSVLSSFAQFVLYAVCHENLPTGSHLFVEKFWQPKMNQKNGATIVVVYHLTRQWPMRNEQALPLWIIGMGAMIGQARWLDSNLTRRNSFWLRLLISLKLLTWVSQVQQLCWCIRLLCL